MKINLLFILSFICMTACFDSTSKESLLNPFFKKCKVVAEKINGQPSRIFEYNENGLSAITFYNAGAVTNKRTVKSEANVIKEIVDVDEKWTYEYNDNGDLVKLNYCHNAQNYCCDINYSYDYTNGSCPLITIVEDCTSGYFRTTNYDYLNLYSCSYFSYKYDKNGNSVGNENGYGIKFDQVINPLFSVVPGTDYYVNKLYNNGDYNEAIILKEVSDSGYPQSLEIDANGTKYTVTYEYECEK